MLVLTRRQGESLRIGNDNKITVCIIYKTQIKLEINDSEVVAIKLQESISIGDGIKISVEKIKESQVQIGIIAPKDVKIDRE
jgi:sRNA-binding carbon storage regulator CsrA|tara:strand:+ start:768 stop:1013 length:246 start_codon:yes stop_codon:yes gene_type:complete